MKRLLLFAFLPAIFLISGNVQGQGLRLGLGGGLTQIQSPDAYTNDVNDFGSGFSGEYHFAAKLKLGLPLIPFSPYAQITYHNFTGDGSTIIGDVEYSQSLLQVAIGGEMSLVPGPVSPYLGFEVALNNFGDFKIEAPALFEDEAEGANSTRFGIALGVGTEITLIPVLDFDVSLKYNFFNLIGKEDGEETVSALTLTAMLLF